MAVDAVADVNAMRDINELTYARKAMVLCGMGLNAERKWEKSQLKPSLQNIVRKHRAVFENPDDEA